MQQAQQSNHSAQPVRCFQMLPLSFFAAVPSNLWSYAKALARREISTNQSKVQALSQSNPPNSTKARCGLSVPSSLHLAMLKFHWPSQKHATRRFNESFINLVNVKPCETTIAIMEFWRAPSDNPSSMKLSSVVKDSFGRSLMVEGTPRDLGTPW